MTAVPEVATTLNDLLAQQQALMHSITRVLDNFKKLGKNNYTAAKVRARIANTKNVWTQCLRVHSALLQAIPEAKRSAFDYFKRELFDQAEDIHLATLDYMAECLEELAPTPPLMTANQVPDAAYSHGSSASSFSLSHLPPINILLRKVRRVGDVPRSLHVPHYKQSRSFCVRANAFSVVKPNRASA
jgi:hypothetical protein